MTEIQEGRLTFIFQDGAEGAKYDDWAFYRNQFKDYCSRDNKAVDLICLADKQAWLIEVKDYRYHSRSKAIDLADEIATKVRDTLAGLVAARFQAHDPLENAIARKVLRVQRVRVVCHLEQPAKGSKLRPRAFEPDKLYDKLRRLLKAIDPHPAIVDHTSVSGQYPWQVLAN